MDRIVAQGAIKTLLQEIGKRLDEAATIGKAAQICADQGNVAKAVEIILDVEQLMYESGNLLNAASTLNRIGGEAC